MSFSDPQNCSIGRLIWPLNDSDRINGGGGTYFLPDEVSCNGNLVSVHTCFFYIDGGNSSNNVFRLCVGVFRQMGDSYIRDDWINIDVRRQNSCETWGCRSLELPDPVPVLAGDRIGVRLRNQCQTQRCPLHPVLNTTRTTSVFFIQPNMITVPVNQVVATTNVHIDVSVSILGKLNVFHGRWTSRVDNIKADLVLKSLKLHYRWNNEHQSVFAIIMECVAMSTNTICGYVYIYYVYLDCM